MNSGRDTVLLRIAKEICTFKNAVKKTLKNG